MTRHTYKAPDKALPNQNNTRLYSSHDSNQILAQKAKSYNDCGDCQVDKYYDKYQFQNSKAICNASLLYFLVAWPVMIVIPTYSKAL